MRTCATEHIDGGDGLSGSCQRTGCRRISDAYRTASPTVHDHVTRKDNVFGVEPGVTHAVSEGYSFRSPSRRQANTRSWWTARYPQAATRPISTVNVIVEAPQVIEPPTT